MSTVATDAATPFWTPQEKQSDKLEQLLTQLLPIAFEWMRDGERGGSVVSSGYVPPQQLASTYDVHLPQQGDDANNTQLMRAVQGILSRSVNPWTGRFMDKLYTSTDAVGVVSELLMGLLNANSHVYRAAPALTLIEIELASRLGELCGWSDTRGGLTMPGGSASNRLALLTAINHLLPGAKEHGIASLERPPVVFTSAHSHYSIEQAALSCGLGARNVVKIRTEESGRMLVDDLELQLQKCIDQGGQPIFINVTAGTTVTGVFDPIRAVARLARQYGSWLHVDGSWGGPVLFSKQYRSLLDGVELADSLTMNPHKLLRVPLQCSFLLLAEQQRLASNRVGAPYLFHGQQYDLGASTTFCGRRPDALKLHLAWQHYGTEGFARMVEDSIESGIKLRRMVQHHPRLALAFDLDESETSALQVCFRYVPHEDARLMDSQLASAAAPSRSQGGAKSANRDRRPSPTDGTFFDTVSDLTALQQLHQLTPPASKPTSPCASLEHSGLSSMSSWALSTPPASQPGSRSGSVDKGPPLHIYSQPISALLRPQQIVRLIHAQLLSQGKIMVDFCPVASKPSPERAHLADENGNIGDVFRIPMHPDTSRASRLIIDEVVRVGAQLFPSEAEVNNSEQA